MKTVYKQIAIIFVLIIMIVLITNILSIKIKKDKSRIIPLSNSHIDASFSSPYYIKDIIETKNDIKKYKNSTINQANKIELSLSNNKNNENEFLNTESDLNINKPFVETFQKSRKVNSPSFLTKIDKILYINLDHRKDRLKQINNEFKKMNFPENKIERISAVRNKYNGHIGCCKSTLKLWI